MSGNSPFMIRFYRTRKGMTQTELGEKAAEILGRDRPFPRSTISLMETGRSLPTDMKQAEAIADTLGVLPSALWPQAILEILAAKDA